MCNSNQNFNSTFLCADVCVTITRFLYHYYCCYYYLTHRIRHSTYIFFVIVFFLLLVQSTVIPIYGCRSGRVCVRLKVISQLGILWIRSRLCIFMIILSITLQYTYSIRCDALMWEPETKLIRQLDGWCIYSHHPRGSIKKVSKLKSSVHFFSKLCIIFTHTYIKQKQHNNKNRKKNAALRVEALIDHVGLSQLISIQFECWPPHLEPERFFGCWESSHFDSRRHMVVCVCKKEREWERIYIMFVVENQFKVLRSPGFWCWHVALYVA